MAYKQSGTERIKDDRSVIFDNITATVERREIGTQTLSNAYVAGGRIPSSPDPNNDINDIDKFPFASDANASATGGTLSVTMLTAAGLSSGSHGYTAGGLIPSNPAPTSRATQIFKYPFAISSGTSSSVGDLNRGRSEQSGINSAGEGFVAGGFGPGDATHPPTGNNSREFLEKFSFAYDGDATEIGDLQEPKRGGAPGNSQTHGYVAGGTGAPPTPATARIRIEKFPFAISSGTSTTVGNLTGNSYNQAGQSSSTHGYRAGGTDNSGPVNIIDKYPFSSDTDATDVGDITAARTFLTGHSSSTHGYSSGGTPGFYFTIDKFPFSSDTNASDVGDLVSGRYGTAGSQG